MRMTDQIVSLFTKCSLVIGYWVFAQVQPLSDAGIVDKAFDYAFSVGLMMLFLVYMVYENRKKDKKQDDNQSAYVDLLRQNTEAIKEFSASNKDVAKSVERSTDAQNEALERLTRAFEKMEQKL